jgi:hypothetical protein
MSSKVIKDLTAGTAGGIAQVCRYSSFLSRLPELVVFTGLLVI